MEWLVSIPHVVPDDNHRMHDCRLCCNDPDKNDESHRVVAIAIRDGYMGGQTLDERTDLIHDFSLSLWPSPPATLWSKASIRAHIRQHDRMLDLEYGQRFGYNPRHVEATTHRYHNHALRSAALPPICIDCSHERLPSSSSSSSVAAASAAAAASGPSAFAVAAASVEAKRREEWAEWLRTRDNLAPHILLPCMHKKNDCKVCGPPTICVHGRHTVVCRQCTIICTAHKVRSCMPCRLTNRCTHDEKAHACHRCFVDERETLNRQQRERDRVRQSHLDNQYNLLMENQSLELARQMQNEEVYQRRSALVSPPPPSHSQPFSLFSSLQSLGSGGQGAGARTMGVGDADLAAAAASVAALTSRRSGTSNNNTQRKRTRQQRAASPPHLTAAAASTATAAASAATAASAPTTSKRKPSAKRSSGLGAAAAAAADCSSSSSSAAAAVAAPSSVTTQPSEEVPLACMVCFERPKDCMLNPCTHVLMCMTCALKLKKCPNCRADIRERKRLILC